MSEEKMLEEFAAWCDSPCDTDQVSNFAWMAWQAACESKQQEINSARTSAIKECAALFNSGMRNREMYINDVEELILGLIKGDQND